MSRQNLAKFKESLEKIRRETLARWSVSSRRYFDVKPCALR